MIKKDLSGPPETLFEGSRGNDILVGTARGDTFIGSKGADTINGLGGVDTVSYANTPFIDIVEINPPAFPYSIAPTAGTGVMVDLEEGTATKTVSTFVVDSYSIIGTSAAFTDRLISIENVIGGLVTDTLLGSSAANVLSGMGGNDTLDGRGGKDSLFGGAGNDSLFGGNDGDVLFGGDDSDLLVGGGGADRIDGGGSDDVEISIYPFLFLPAGIQVPDIMAVRGDVASYAGSSTGIQVDLHINGPQSGGDAQGDLLTNVESIRGSAFDDSIAVNGGYAFGNDGRDQLYGGELSDALIGGGASDRLFGGAGDDWLVGDDVNSQGSASLDRHTSDELYGGDGNDFLVGGVGADVLNGGNGDDLYYMVEADDIVRDASGVDTIATAQSTFALGNDFENLVFLSDGNATAHIGYGNAGNNIIAGSSGDDTLFAGAGEDTLDGGNGDDVLSDLVGNDTIIFGYGTDVAIGFGATGGAEQDIIDLSSWGYGSLQDFYDQGGTITQVGSNTQIQVYDGGPVLILQDVAASSIDDTDFNFS